MMRNIKCPNSNKSPVSRPLVTKYDTPISQRLPALPTTGANSHCNERPSPNVKSWSNTIIIKNIVPNIKRTCRTSKKQTADSIISALSDEVV